MRKRKLTLWDTVFIELHGPRGVGKGSHKPIVTPRSFWLRSGRQRTTVSANTAKNQM